MPKAGLPPVDPIGLRFVSAWPSGGTLEAYRDPEQDLEVLSTCGQP